MDERTGSLLRDHRDKGKKDDKTKVERNVGVRAALRNFDS